MFYNGHMRLVTNLDIGLEVYFNTMKKLILILKFLRTGLTIRNLVISIFGGLAMILFLLIIQFLIGGLDNFFDDDLIFPFIVGASVSLMKFEKSTRTWKEFSEKNK